MTPKSDLYKTLQVDPEAEAEVIAVAYKRLASKYHPDVNPSPDSGRRMRDLNAAFEVLSDPDRRARYDVTRSRTSSRGRARSSEPSPASSGVGALSLVVTPRSLAFGRVRKGANPTMRLEVAVPEGRTLIGDVRASHAWIQVSASRIFSDRTTVQVTIDTTTLDEGEHYSGSVTIDSVVFGVRTVPVTLNLALLPKPVLRVSPTLLDFGELRSGQPPKVIELTISNAGSGHLSGVIKPRQAWLSVSHGAFAGNASSVQVMAGAAGLPEGDAYNGEVEITSNGGRGIIVARLAVPASAGASTAPGASRVQRVTTRDRAFLEARQNILARQSYLTTEQQQERNIIQYLLRVCRGGDVADMLQRGLATAQGAEGIGWRDDRGVLQSTSAAVAILGGLLERLHRWEETER